MTNKKGFTLVELIVSIGLLGMIALVGLVMLSFSYRYLLESRKYSQDTFLAQQNAELLLEVARSNQVGTVPDISYMPVDLFGKTVAAHIIDSDIPTEGESAHGEINALVPQYFFTYDVPVVESVSMQVQDVSADITSQSFYYPLDTDIVFTGSHTMGDETYFLLNVYRWYMSPVMDNQSEIPTSKDWIIIKEWNQARTPLDYEDSFDFTFIPNIEDDYDSLDFERDFDFNDDEVGIRFGGRYFCYSVTPYSEIGRVGQEVFSNTFSTERIDSLKQPATDFVEYSVFDEDHQYSIDIDTVTAVMHFGTEREVEVEWETNTIDFSAGPGSYTVDGMVVGFEDEDNIDVQFQLVVTDEEVDPVLTEINILGPENVQVPFSGSVEISFSADLKGTDGVSPDPISLNGLIDVTWSLSGTYTGIRIDDPDSGVVIIDPSAGNTSFTVVASAGGQTSEKTVLTSKVDQENSYFTTTNTIESNVYYTQYNISLYNNLGQESDNGIENLNENSLKVDRVYYVGDESYKTIPEIENLRTGDQVSELINLGNGQYQFKVAVGSPYWFWLWQINPQTSNNGGLRVYYGSSQIQIYANYNSQMNNTVYYWP